MKTICEIETYPDDTSVKNEKVTITNHWSSHDRVVIQIGDKKLVLIADHLRKAITNCTNQPI
jgi:hypothetical protein